MIDDVEFGYNESNDRNFMLITIHNVGSTVATIDTIYVYAGGTWTKADSKWVYNGTNVLTASDINFDIGVDEIRGIGLTDHTAWDSAIISAIPDKLVSIAFNENLLTNTTYRIKVVSESGMTVEADFDTQSSW